MAPVRDPKKGRQREATTGDQSREASHSVLILDIILVGICEDCCRQACLGTRTRRPSGTFPPSVPLRDKASLAIAARAASTFALDASVATDCGDSTGGTLGHRGVPPRAFLAGEKTLLGRDMIVGMPFLNVQFFSKMN